MKSSIFDSLKSQSNYALAVVAVSGTVIASSLTANMFEFLVILTLCLSSFVLFSYSLGMLVYLRKTRPDLADLRVDTAMEKHTLSRPIISVAIALFFAIVMIVRARYPIDPQYANEITSLAEIIFSIAIVTQCIAMVNSALLNMTKVLLINHKLVTTPRTSSQATNTYRF